VNNASTHHHYNPDWLSDDDLAANFVARLDDFAFLRDELARAPLQGSAQHYLLVGVRGAGKTTLLKRLAVAIRRDADLCDHLIALSFPEELYQVKNLADFWWAACEALADELDRMGRSDTADTVMDSIAQAKKSGISSGISADPLANAGLQHLLQTCASLGLRPVLLVDNLDMVFQRIDKAGRKLKDPHAPAYWALREALSTTTSPIVIGGSVRLSEPFTDYDKAFYDFFIPKRLGKLSLQEARLVLDRLADAQGVPEVKQRLIDRPSRIEALYTLTGGNPRALGLIFELLRQGPNSRAVQDFERLMDITTPYYKARFEELAEQAQVVMHALAVCRPEDAAGSGLRFGLTAAEIGAHAGLPTGSVSAQLDAQEREGLVEKSAAHGRTQYRIAEQLFRLWLQMRGSRRIRQNVIGLTQYLEAMFSVEELQTGLHAQASKDHEAQARYAFAFSDANDAMHLRRGLEAKGADHLLQHLKAKGGAIEDYLHAGDLPEDLHALLLLHEKLQKCSRGNSGLDADEQDSLLGSIELSLEQKQSSVQSLCISTSAKDELIRLRPILAKEYQRLLRYGLNSNDLPMLFYSRARGCLPLPLLTPQHADEAVPMAPDATAFRAMVWRLLGDRNSVTFIDDTAASAWLDWGKQYAGGANANEWANVAFTLLLSRCFEPAKQALDHAFSLQETWYAWLVRGSLLDDTDADVAEVELAYRQSIALDPAQAHAWGFLGRLLANKLNRYNEAEVAYRRAIELDPAEGLTWNSLGGLLADKLNRYEDAEAAYRKAIELDPEKGFVWICLGRLLAEKLHRYEDAEAAYRKAVELDPVEGFFWNCLGRLLAEKLHRYEDAEAAYRKAVEFDPVEGFFWNCLGRLLAEKLHRYEEAEFAYRKEIEVDPTAPHPWIDLAILFEDQGRWEEASAACARASVLNPKLDSYWHEKHADLQTRVFTNAAKLALDAANLPALREALSQLLAESVDIPSALASTHFVEGFLAEVLAQGKQAAAVLDLLRELGFARHARPLLLAFEAAVANRPDMLAELEPEVQRAALRMFERLSAPTGEVPGKTAKATVKRTKKKAQ
jgi:tetratricopeptide (TPR) repeat protein